MTKGKQYLKMFDAGMTYAEIAREFSCSRNTIASTIYRYREDNGLAVDYRSKLKKERDAAMKPSNNFYKFDHDSREARIKAIKKCKKREDGVTQCPTRYSCGYVNHKGHFDG